VHDATIPPAAAAAPVRPSRLPGGPLPLTMRQGAVAAIVALVIGLGAALGTPIAAALEARRVTPPGSVTVGSAVVLPAAGWAVQAQQGGSVLLTRGGAQMVVRWEPGTPPDPQTSLSRLASATQQVVPDARGFGGVRQFSTPSSDMGYLEPFAAAGTTGAIAVVQSAGGQAVVQAIAPSTTFASVADDILAMVTGIRIQRGSGS
jgi:hypothetical protein